MSIMDDYKQLQMIENVKKFKEMEIAYKANLQLCKYQGQQINKLATCIEEIKKIAEEWQYAEGAFELAEEILNKISEVEDGV